MNWFLGTHVFWTAIVCALVMLSAMTIVGRPWSLAFPPEFREAARIYLSPVMGLATFILIASSLGRHLPLGDTIVVPLIFVFALLVALRLDPDPWQGIRSIATVAAVGIAGGVTVFVPLYISGAFNPHNDAFTYLAHADWLQQNAFATHIPVDKITPAETQIVLYQRGLRMGGSFLLAFFQALLNIRWSYDVYPAVIVSAMTSCALAIGFPIARLLAPLQLPVRLALLALPCFSLGGLVFGANFGFLAQTVGLATASGVIFSTGALLYWLCSERRNFAAIAVFSFPVALLLAATIFAYSEFVPFVFIAVALSCAYAAIRSGMWRNVVLFSGTLAVLTIALANFELLRAYTSLRVQAGAVVGGAVDWTPLGFLGHAFGVHAGAWDSQQFNWLSMAWSIVFILGLVPVMTSTRWGSLRAEASPLGPALALLLSLSAAFVYFRYVATSPFPTGKGQSWSQFKLTEWANPFAAALVLAGLAACLAGPRKYPRRMAVALIGLAALGAAVIGSQRVRNLMSYYEDVPDLGRFYLDFRKTVFAACPLGSSIYLELGGADHKLRQMAALYLWDRDVRADWSDDGYIYSNLPRDRITASVRPGDCLVEPLRGPSSMKTASVVGPVRVGVFSETSIFQIGPVDGAYDLESSGPNWWRWVEHAATFHFLTGQSRGEHSRINVKFNYLSRTDHPLSVRISVSPDQPPLIFRTEDGKREGVFDRDVDIGRIENLSVSISSTDEALPLGDRDPRKAAFMIRDLSVSGAG